jgi:diguanylate cyclase (GGDEF)-like protein/PAS domain S-box-containing protein
MNVDAGPSSVRAAPANATWRGVLPGFLRWFVLFASLIGVVNVLMIQAEVTHQRQLRENTARSQTVLVGKNIALTLRTIAADLQFLAQSAAVRRLFEHPEDTGESLAGDLLGFSLHKGWYDQVRYLDLSGRERVRVDLRQGRPHLVEGAALQDKSGRYYFTDTRRLGAGEIFVSPLDLNIEHGKIEQPLKPMLRFGTPVFGTDGQKKGVLVLNFLARYMLDDLRALAPEAEGALYLLNADGYWLFSPDPGEEWGFMYPERGKVTFASRHAGVWQQIQQQESGTISDGQAHFVFSTLRPLASLSGIGSGAPGAGDDTAMRYRWYIVSRYPGSAFVDVAGKPATVASLLLTLLLAAVGAWFVARSMQQNRTILEHRVLSATREAQETIRTLSLAVEQSPVSVVITDPDANIEYVNRGFETATGYSAAEVIGKNPRILKSGDMSQRVYEDLWRTIRQGEVWSGEFQNRRKDGSLFWERAFLSPVMDEDGAIRHFLAIKEDISLQKAQEEQILHQAHFDFLTGLPNRLLALDRLKQQLKAAERETRQVAVLYLDMDDFKKVNDTLGHETGDRLLVEAARRLKSAVRGEDTVARLGGDEFLVILGALDDSRAASSVAEHLLAIFRSPFLLGDNEMVVTITVGIALYPQDGSGVSDLLRNADVAMYQAKQGGRNTYRYFTATMNRDTERRLALEARLRGALQRRDLTLYLQVIVAIDSELPVGVEALLRWHDEELGHVPPAEFIPVAEQSGLINVIGMYVLAEAARQAVRLRAAFGDGFYVSVNVSPQQFRDVDFPLYVEEALLGTGLPGEALVLEITEGVLLKGNRQVEDILTRLRALRVRLSMDDFGTGYSSLSYLRRYPFDVLKVDKSFIRDIVTDPRDRELVRAALEMAHALGLKVVAEGVEETAQKDLLGEWRCDFGQGYLFGRPLPADQIGPEAVTGLAVS